MTHFGPLKGARCAATGTGMESTPSEWPYLIGQCTAVRLRSTARPPTQFVYVGAKTVPTQCRAVPVPKVIRAITLQPSLRQSDAVDKAPLQDRALRIGLPRSLKDVLTICAHTLLLTPVQCAVWSGLLRTTAGGPFQREIHRRIVQSHGSCSSVTVCSEQGCQRYCAHSTACFR